MTIKSQEGTLDLCRAKRVAEALMQRCRVQPVSQVRHADAFDTVSLPPNA